MFTHKGQMASNVKDPTTSTKDKVTSCQFSWVLLFRPVHSFFHWKYEEVTCNTAITTWHGNPGKSFIWRIYGAEMSKAFNFHQFWSIPQQSGSIMGEWSISVPLFKNQTGRSKKYGDEVTTLFSPHLRITRVFSRDALTQVSSPFSARFKIWPKELFSKDDFFTTQSARCKHWTHPRLIDRRNCDLAADVIKLILVMPLLTMLTR